LTTLEDFCDVKKYLMENYGDKKIIPSVNDINSDPNLNTHYKVLTLFKKHTNKSISEYFSEMGCVPKNRINPSKVDEICKILICKAEEIQRIPIKSEIEKDNRLPSPAAIRKLFKSRGYKSYVDFLIEKGFKVKTEKSRPFNISYDQLCSLWENFYKDNQRYPNSLDCLRDTKLPKWRTVRLVCGDRFNEFYEKYGTGSIKTKDYDFYCKLIKELSFENKRVLTIKDLSKYNLPSSEWLVKHCPSEEVTNYNEFLCYLGLKPYSKIPKEYIVKQVIKKYNKLKRPLQTSDFETATFDDVNFCTILNHWSSLSEMLEELNIPYFGGDEYRHNRLESMKNDIQELCNDVYHTEGRKNISHDDIKKSKFCLSPQTYDKWFTTELNMSLCEYIESIGFIPNKIGSGMTYKFEDGEITKSRYEYYISKYLREKGIEYERDVKYEKILKSYCGRKDCDYVLSTVDGEWYIEVAGIEGVEKYEQGIKEKVKMLEKSKVRYKILYPKDFKRKTIDEIFSFLYK
jgi:hypothetical protein